MFRGFHPVVASFALAPMLLLSAMAHAQSKGPSPKAAGEPGGFSAKGLNYETELTALHLGDFAHARLQRDGAEFDFLFGNYLKAFARRCSAYLPANKVEMTRPECAREQYAVNRYGARTGPSTCVEYRQVGTGLYADPDLYAAQQKVEVEVGRNMMRDTFRGMSGNNPMATGMRAVDAATSVGRDMDSLLELNSCASPGLKRFQDNMMRDTFRGMSGNNPMATGMRAIDAAFLLEMRRVALRRSSGATRSTAPTEGARGPSRSSSVTACRSVYSFSTSRRLVERRAGESSRPTKTAVTGTSDSARPLIVSLQPR